GRGSADEPVPLRDHGLLTLPAHDADAGRTEREQPASFRWQTEPPRREHAEEVSVREHQGVACAVANPLDDAIGPRCDVRRGLAAGHTVTPQRPARYRLPDLSGRQALILAVVPLDE